MATGQIAVSITSRKSKAAFTRVEVTVVIGLLVVLVIALSPVFQRARENPHKRSCQSNLKQILLAFQQYTQDFDEVFPLLKAGHQPVTAALQRLGEFALSLHQILHNSCLCLFACYLAGQDDVRVQLEFARRQAEQDCPAHQEYRRFLRDRRRGRRLSVRQRSPCGQSSPGRLQLRLCGRARQLAAKHQGALVVQRSGDRY